ncbi:hypothetical protein NED98_10600 [Sphingomonas sp. MMSM20]|uniref:hypothetical protein n=1 Tax=Sphingomonas lycopersici TaxID=2951807 RepID=UPI002239008F|nr:hypothetical protein [Sphingomonas lycopersici]MCW6530697.1 hypothetical protein [Sphingomonas lycopersici]
MRPKAIRWFERFLLAALLVDLANNISSRSAIAASKSARAFLYNEITISIVSIIPVAVGIFFWFLISKKRSNVARWILTTLVVCGILGFAATFLQNTNIASQRMFFIAAMAELLKIVAVACLFFPEASGWFAREQRPI